MELNITTIGIEVEGKDVEVYSYLPMNEKIAAGVVAVTGAVSSDNRSFSDGAFEAILLYQVVANYTNFTKVFPDIAEIGILQAYDILETNGIIKTVIEVVSEEMPGEIDSFIKYSEIMKDDFKAEFNGPAKAFSETLESMINMGTDENIETLENLEEDLEEDTEKDISDKN